jgi:hypothetical protein
MGRKPKVDEAFQDEVLELLSDGFPAPDRHFGPLYRGNGGQEASAALAAEIAACVGADERPPEAVPDSLNRPARPA